jgi:hypothetical protein
MTTLDHQARLAAPRLLRCSMMAAVLCVALAAVTAVPSGRLQVSLTLGTDLDRARVELSGEGLFDGR